MITVKTKYKTCFILLSILAYTNLIACSFIPEKPVAEIAKAKDLINQGVYQLETGYPEQALATFEMSFEIYPHAEALDGIGCVYLYLNELEEAEEYFILATEFDPSYPTALGHLATIYEIRAYPDLANKYYLAALEQDPKDVRIRNNYAAFLFDQTQNKSITNTEKSVLGQNIRRELLRVNSLTNSDIIKDNFKIMENSYEH
jgi:tetratricopeptide (TPR) repeat protein